MTNNEIRHYADFSMKVFEYFNGRVNLVNKDPIFIISYDPSESSLGECYLNSMVVLHLTELLDRCKDMDCSYIYNNIVFTIVHELFHSDQNMNINEYKSNIEYQNKIENEVNHMTLLFLLQNKYFIDRDLQINLEEQSLRLFLARLVSKNYIKYKRANLFNFYKNALNILFPMKNTSISDLLYHENNIEFICNRESVFVKYQGELVQNTRPFHDIINRYFNLKNRVNDVSIYRDTISNIIRLCIETK